MVLFAGAALAATGAPDGFFSWAWERHQNALSFYIRPLFILPLAYSTYKRSLFGILLMLAALSTRMFRFPAPGRTDPRVEGLLAFERGWLTGGWAMEKVVSTLAVAPVLGVLCLASWRRLSLWGLLVINAIAVGKMAWGGLHWVSYPSMVGCGLRRSGPRHAFFCLNLQGPHRFHRAHFMPTPVRGDVSVTRAFALTRTRVVIFRTSKCPVR